VGMGDCLPSSADGREVFVVALQMIPGSNTALGPSGPPGRRKSTAHILGSSARVEDRPYGKRFLPTGADLPGGTDLRPKCLQKVK